MKKYLLLFLFSSLLMQGQIILNQTESSSRTVQDPYKVILSPGFYANAATVNSFIAKIGVSTEVAPASPNNSTAGVTNPSGELAGGTSSFHDTKGNIDVNGGGQLQFSLPIALPPGVKSVAPQMNLVYTSGTGNGIAGIGFSLSGITSINRTVKNIEKDGESKGVQLDYTDFYEFNGQRLLLKTGEYGKNGAEYVTEKFSTLKIKSLGAITGQAYTGPESFEVTFDNGSQGWYGTTADSKTPMEYNLVKWKDAQGNYITYNYTKNNNVAVISSVFWGGNETLMKPHFNSIAFNYDSNRAVKEVSYVRGVKFLQDKILSNIVVNANGNLFKKYVVEYTNDTNNTNYQYANKITEYNSLNQAANPVTFSYETSSSSGWAAKAFTDNVNDKIVGDFDGDGNVDYLKYHGQFYECLEYGIDYSTIGIGGAWGYSPDGTNISLGPVCLQSVLRNSGLTLRKTFLSETIDQNINFASQPFPFTNEEFNKAKVVSFRNSNNEISARQGFLITKRLANQDLEFQIYSITDNLTVKLESTKKIESSQYESYSNYIDSSNNSWSEIETIKSFSESRPLDLDGDGITEIVIPVRTNTKILSYDPLGENNYSESNSYQYLILNLDKDVIGNDAISEVLTSNSGVNIFSNLKVGDFKGDGKVQVLEYRQGGSSDHCFLTSFIKDKLTQKYSTLIESYTGSIKGLTSSTVFGDFNGDRKTDLLVPAANGSSDWYFYTSTGTGFKEEYKSGLLNFKPFEENNYTSNTHVDFYEARKQTYQALDLDKDGKSELIGFNYYTKEHTQSGYNHRDFSNTSITIIKNSGANATTDVNFFQAYYHSFDFALFDFNELVGDYQINQINNSILLVGTNRRDKSQGLLFSFNLYDTSKTARINKIIQGNVPTIVDYKELRKDYSFYHTEKKEQYPFVELENISNSFAVSQLSQLDRKQDFRYRGLIAHVNGRGMIGFRKSARSNWYATGFENTKMWSALEIDPLQNGVIVKQWSTRLDSDVFPTDVSVNNSQLISFKSLTYITEKPNPDGPEAILPKSSIEKDFLKNIAKTETITYGDYYLATKVETSINNGFATATTNTKYEDNVSGVGANYFIGRITEKEDIATAYGDTKKLKTKYTYQNNLPETVKTYNQDESEFTLETYINDGFGNITEKTVTNNKDAQTQNSKIEFDNKGRFAIKSIDNLGLISESTYNDLGQVLAQTDPLGNTITNTYDGWGKPLTIKKNLSGTTTFTYKKEGDDIVTIQYSPDGATTETRTNKKGEQYLIKTKGFESGTYIAKQVVYDAVGRKIKESEPYFTSGSIKWNMIAYDDNQFPAKVTVTSFNGKILETEIVDKVTTIKELNGYGRITKKTTDVIGNVVESEDQGGVIKFTFNALGQNLTAAYGQNVVRTTYDTWGRKMSFNDPSNGLYSYEYDGFGKIKKETSPKGTKEYIYNTLGQLTNQKEFSTDDGGANTNKTITYAYDAKGLIISKTGTANGKDYNSSITYDSNGRITSTKENSNNRFFFKKNITYDDKGRVTNYEKGLYSSVGLTKTNIENLYSIWGGDLYQVKDKSTAKVLWELQKSKANGQVLEAKLGSVAVKNIYDDNNFLTSISHSSALQPNVLQMSYAFNAIKNELNSRSRTGLISLNEVFEYDGNNRLKTWTNPKTNQLSTNGYDDKGRILQNDQVGTIDFKTDKIYQAKAVTLNAAGEQNYLNNIKQIITYNENNDPIYINGEKGDVLFSYGLTEMRQMATYGGNFDTNTQGKYTKYYSEDGSNEIIVDNTTGLEKHIVYIGGSPYDSNIIFVKNYNDTAAKYLFLHKDYLGSILAISDENGNSVEQRHFDAWGILTHGEMKVLDKGYTSHEHFDEVGIIHMNGRLYDPLLRRFLNADENIQEPYNTQNYNKYGYVFNNPLLFNDPSGETGFAIAGLAIAAAIAAVVAVTTYTIGLILNNRLDQFHGGQALKSAFWGAVSGAVSYGIGSVFATGGTVAKTLGSATFLVQAVAHGVAQGALSSMQGGSFWQGAAGGFFGSLGASAWSAAAPNWSQSAVGTIAFGAIAGGVGAELTGGNFWQGAITGGIVSGLNHAMHQIQVNAQNRNINIEVTDKITGEVTVKSQGNEYVTPTYEMNVTGTDGDGVNIAETFDVVRFGVKDGKVQTLKAGNYTVRQYYRMFGTMPAFRVNGPYAIHMLSANRVDANWGCIAIKGGASEWNRFTTALGTISGMGLYDLGSSGTMNVNVQYVKTPNVYIKK